MSIRPPKHLDVIEGDLPAGVGSLSQRIANLTTTLDGTPEQPEIGLIARVRSLEDDRKRVLNRLNLWGGIILGALAANGLGSGALANIIHPILKAIAGS